MVLVTAPDVATAERLGRVLVEDRLAACVNVVPGITSLYRWEGAVHEDAEVLMIVKTTVAGIEAVRRRVRELHPYDTPEVIDIDISGGDPGYLAWVRSAVGEGGS